MTDVPLIREMLASSCESSAHWRTGKIEQYPDDVRNRTSAVALKQAARDIAGLPDDDPRLRHLADVVAVNVGDGWSENNDYAEEESRLIGRHGFGRGDTQTTDELLAALVRMASETLRRSLEIDAELDRGED